MSEYTFSPGGAVIAKLWDTTLGSDAASIDTGATIPGGYSALWGYIYGRTSEAVVTGGVDITFNGDTSAHYDVQRIRANTSTVDTGASAAASALNVYCSGNNAAANVFSLLEFFLPNYAGTSGYKPMRLTSCNPHTTSTDMFQNLYNLGFRSTSAINQMKVAGESGSNLKSGSRLVIYGLP